MPLQAFIDFFKNLFPNILNMESYGGEMPWKPWRVDKNITIKVYKNASRVKLCSKDEKLHIW